MMMQTLVTVVLWLAVTVLMVASTWRIFTKAHLPGWGSLIPIYNLYLWFKLAGKSGWWLLLLLIPFVNLIALFICLISAARAFGRSGWFGVGMIFLSVIFFPILAFGDATYSPPAPRPA
jgi:hypothetical protein